MKIDREEFRAFAQALWQVLREEPQNVGEVPASMRGAVASLRLFLGLDRMSPLIADTEVVVDQLETQRGPAVMTGRADWQHDPATGRMRFDQIHSTPGRLAAQNLRNFSSVWGASDVSVQEPSE